MASKNSSLLLATLPKSIRPRGYQLELFERSMKGNVIVAMDTGSGKTHIALIRIIAEMDRCPPGKRIWFLAPTVDLCTQQHDSIRSYLPAFGTRLLVGSDGVDRWSEQRIWDDVLHDIQIVVSTHKVLSDALTHGFVNMLELSLLIFDEAHHCARGHPANTIMQTFYHPLKEGHGNVTLPHILGLSASPIARSKVTELELIESNLDSISVTPRVNRHEMFRYVHRPTLLRVEFNPCSDPGDAKGTSIALSCLKDICRSKNISFGPTTPKFGQLLHMLPKQCKGSPVENQLSKFCTKAIHIYNELGKWASDYFILESISVLAKRDDAGVDPFRQIEERDSLLRILDNGPLRVLRQKEDFTGTFALSNKVENLISFLHCQDFKKCSGILFVQQRAVVSVLCKLLSTHPKIKGRFQCATFVGMSNNARKKYGMTELLDLKAQCEILAGFRTREKNLIIATDVLEEGIDITACNLVFCFDPPANVKSFIQRRGRARQEKSQFAIMFPKGEGVSKIELWRSLEATLIETYQTEQRKIHALKALEDNDFDVVPGKLFIESTRACITPDLAISHLYHFCACLPHEPYVDLMPKFSYDVDPVTNLISATVTLPNCLIPSLRSTKGIGGWRTEKCATRDASFQAYNALYKAGLLNDNLLPLSNTREADEQHDQEDMVAILEIKSQFSPWKSMAQMWSHGNIHQTHIVLKCEGGDSDEDLCMVLTTPSPMPTLPPFVICWDEETKFRVHFGSSRNIALSDSGTLQTLRNITHVLTRSTRSDYTTDDRVDFIALFSPDLEEHQLSNWYQENNGRVPAIERYVSQSKQCGLIRSPTLQGVPHQFYGWHIPVEETDSKLGVRCIPLTKKRNFLLSNNLARKISPSHGVSPWKFQSFPIHDCTVDRLSFSYTRFSLFMQSILQQVRSFMTAEELCSTVLKDVPIKDITHIITAISAPSAGLITDYQRYEFFGDAVLKFFVSHQLYCEKKNWHEGYLTVHKNWLVSNQKLARAALEKKLDVFIMTEGLQSKKWIPPFISDYCKDSIEPRKSSMKVLADVVEALIGAAYMDGGFSLARRCLHVFLPEIRIETPRPNRHLPSAGKTTPIIKAESIIGYKFNAQIFLLESLTHPSCSHDVGTESYQRLEFLGDAVLDMLVVKLLASLQPANARSPGKMTLIKAAVVNSDFLGYLCINYGIHSTKVAGIEETALGCFRKNIVSHTSRLWTLMRHSNNKDIKSSQEACQARYITHRDAIHHDLTTGVAYPWLPLARLNIDKFYSDMIESIIGAIFLDSNCSLAACEDFIVRIGLVSYLSRAMAEGVDMQHPKSILGELAGTEVVSYDAKLVSRGPDSIGTHEYGCTVTVGGIYIARAENCLSKEEAVLEGAIQAADILRERNRLTIPVRGGP